MAYATIEKVNELLGPHAVTATTQPTVSQARSMIDGISAQIDTVLKGAGVASVPVTSADDATFAAYLIEVEKWGAAAAIIKALFPDAAGPGESPAHAFFEERYQNALANFREGKDIPAGLLGGSNNPSPSSYFTRNTEQEEELGTLAGAHLTKMGDTF